MALRQLVTVFALLALAAVQGAGSCAIDTTSWFGVPWKPAFALYSSENGWKKYGGLSNVDLFYNKNSGCVTGLRVTYDNKHSTAKLLGLDRNGQATAGLALGAKEVISKAEITYGRCITYLSLATNKRKVIAIGNSSTPGTKAVSTPGPQGGYLAYIKAYTDEHAEGSLKRVQLVWATLDCATELPARAEILRAEQAPAAADTPAPEPAPEVVEATTVTVTEEQNNAGGMTVVQQEQQLIGPEPLGPQNPSAPPNTTDAAPVAVPEPELTVVPGPVASDAPEASNMVASAKPSRAAACSANQLCKDGTCPTSSCAVNGLGKDVVPMACFGTNIVPNPILDKTIGNPCQNLACKLDKPNCTSVGMLGVGGFCTGKVVSMGNTAKLHPTGQSFLGYPCIEHKGAVLDLLPMGDYSARGTFIAKAWKVCDCVNGFGFSFDGLSVKIGQNGGLRLSTAKFPMSPTFPFLKKHLMNMTLPDVISQWVAANQADAKIPEVTVSEEQLSKIKILLPDFAVPSIVVPKISAPLLDMPAHISLPVFTIPFGNKTLHRFTLIVPNVTSLPTLIMAKAHAAPSNLKITIPEVTIASLYDLAPTFGVPTMPKLPPVFNMSFQDTVTQWIAAKALAVQVPQMRLEGKKVKALQAIINGFTVPSLLVTNISAPLMKLPSPFPLPVVVIGDNRTLLQVSKVIPKLSAIPTVVLPDTAQAALPDLPQLTIPDITAPNFDAVATALGAKLSRWPKVPSLNFPSLPTVNFTLPEFSLPEVDLKDALSKLNLSIPDVSTLKIPEFLSAAANQQNPQLDLSGLTEVLNAIKAGLTEKIGQIAAAAETMSASIDKAGDKSTWSSPDTPAAAGSNTSTMTEPAASTAANGTTEVPAAEATAPTTVEAPAEDAAATSAPAAETTTAPAEATPTTTDTTVGTPAAPETDANAAPAAEPAPPETASVATAPAVNATADTATTEAPSAAAAATNASSAAATDATATPTFEPAAASTATANPAQPPPPTETTATPDGAVTATTAAPQEPTTTPGASNTSSTGPAAANSSAVSTGQTATEPGKDGSPTEATKPSASH